MRAVKSAVMSHSAGRFKPPPTATPDYIAKPQTEPRTDIRDKRSTKTVSSGFPPRKDHAYGGPHRRRLGLATRSRASPAGGKQRKANTLSHSRLRRRRQDTHKLDSNFV